MLITSRTQEGKPLSQERMEQVSLTENPRIDRILQQVMARMNQEAEHGRAEGSACVHGTRE